MFPLRQHIKVRDVPANTKHLYNIYTTAALYNMYTTAAQMLYKCLTFAGASSSNSTTFRVDRFTYSVRFTV